MANKKPSLQYQDFRPLRKGEGGYSKTARKYISPSTGEIIPVAKFQKLAHGGKSYTARRHEKEILHGQKVKTYRARNTDAYKRFMTSYVDKQNSIRAGQGLPPMTRGEARTNDDFKKAYADLVREGKKKSADKSPGGKLSRALVDLGVRDENADYPVGETPD